MMAGDGGKKGKGDNENSEQIEGELVPSSEKPQEVHGELEKIADTEEDLRANSRTLYEGTTGRRPPLRRLRMSFVHFRQGQAAWSAASYNLVTKEETVAAYVYKMDRPWLRPDEVRVEIRWGCALWVIGQGDEPVKVELPSLNKMRVSEATASMNADSVLTITIPKRDQPWKWYEHKDLVLRFLAKLVLAVS